MNTVTPDPQYQAFSTLRDVETQLEILLAHVRTALENIQGKGETPDFGESSDHLDYRLGRNPKRGLSPLGEQVVTAMIRAGLNDKEIGARTSVTPAGIGFFRRKVLGIRKHS